MGFVKDAVSGVLGGGSDDAKDAAEIQAQSAQAAIEQQKLALEEQIAAREQAREDLAPFREAGVEKLDNLDREVDVLGQRVNNQEQRAQDLIKFARDPKKQRNFIRKNKFFDALADDAEDRIFKNQAARGKVGSGGTAEALQNSLLLLGADLVNQNFNQRLAAFDASQAAFGAHATEVDDLTNVAALGANAAAGQATATQNTSAQLARTSNNIADLITQGGNAQAAGVIGARNAEVGAFNNLVDIGLAGLALSDERLKENIRWVGFTESGLPVYTFTYIGDDTPQMGVMAQDVEQLFPDAVTEVNGVKHVDYARVA